MAQDETGRPPTGRRGDELAGNRRQLIRLAIQRRPEITPAALLHTLDALEIEADERTLAADLADLGFTVERDGDGDGTERLVRTVAGAPVSPAIATEAALEPEALRRPVVVAVTVAGTVLVVVLLGVLLFRTPTSGDAPVTAAGASTLPLGSQSTPSTERVAPPGPGTDPVLAGAGVAVDRFSRTAATLGTFATVGPYAVGAGGWAVADGHATLGEPNPGGPSLVWVDVGSADVRAQVTLVDAVQGAGIAFRVVDRRNYWLWVASPSYATCTAIHVVDGWGTIVGNSGITDVAPGMTLGVHAAGKDIELLANGVVVRQIVDAGTVAGTGVGMGEYENGRTAAFDDLTFLRS